MDDQHQNVPNIGQPKHQQPGSHTTKLEWWDYAQIAPAGEAKRIIEENTPPEEDSEWSNIVFCYWKKTSLDHVYSVARLTELFLSHGCIVRMHRDAKRRKAYVEMETVEQCFKASKALNFEILDSGKRLMVYMTKHSIPPIPNLKPITESGYVNPKVPGLYVQLDAITSEEETALLDLVDSHPWGIATFHLEPRNRRVQHYGYRFNYDTKRADQDEIDPLPSSCKGMHLNERIAKLVNKIQQETGMSVTCDSATWQADQLTVNEYLPGQGIGPHVDTHSAFDGAIVSLSLAGAIAMRISSGPNASEEFGEELYLPRRSLLVLAGDARYGFCHGISHRKTDLVNNVVIPRVRRVSYTFRKVSHSKKCDCSFPVLCDVQQPLGAKKLRVADTPVAKEASTTEHAADISNTSVATETCNT